MKQGLATKIAFAACASLSLPVFADGGRSFAVVSLIGDSITVVAAQRQIGSLVDQNARKTFDLPPAVIDNVALLAADDAIRATEPGASTVLLSIASKSLRDRQSNLIEAGHLVEAEELSAPLKKSGATDLVLMTKHRADTQLETVDKDDSVGHGTLYGLGFYLDRTSIMRTTESEDRASGYLAPYAYFNIYLVDLATSKELGERTIVANTMYPNFENNTSADPWDILSLEAKFKALDELVKSQIMTELPILLR